MVIMVKYNTSEKEISPSWWSRNPSRSNQRRLKTRPKSTRTNANRVAKILAGDQVFGVATIRRLPDSFQLLPEIVNLAIMHAPLRVRPPVR